MSHWLTVWLFRWGQSSGAGAAAARIECRFVLSSCRHETQTTLLLYVGWRQRTNRRGRGWVRVLAGERSDGKRRGPGIHRGRMKRWVMKKKDGGGGTIGGDTWNGGEQTEWLSWWDSLYIISCQCFRFNYIMRQLMCPSNWIINRETGKFDTGAEKKRGLWQRDREGERTLLYPVTGSALSCPYPSWKLKTRSQTLTEDETGRHW